MLKMNCSLIEMIGIFSSYNIFDGITSEYGGHNQGISGWIAPPPIDIQGNK